MKPELKDALALKLLAMADDELILGHRNSEWCGHAPILEEDIAFANIALDEQGHAAVWYGLHATLVEKSVDRYPDQLAFLRDAKDFRNAPFVELPVGDWAFTMLRQALFDLAEAVRLEHVIRSQHPPIAEAAAKIHKEEVYHTRHTGIWVRRLGLGTEESHRRMQAAVDQLWPYALEFFEPVDGESQLAEAGYVPDPALIRSIWEDRAISLLVDSDLVIPAPTPASGFSRTHHTPHLAELLGEMQSVARALPDAKW